MPHDGKPATMQKLELFVILGSEFPCQDLHDITRDVGCATHDGEAFVFLDGLIAESNMPSEDLGLICYYCKLAKATPIEIEGLRERINLSCSLDHDNVLEAILDEIDRVSIHELVHACGLSDEEYAKNATFAVTPRWDPCRKMVDKR